jgi:endonuclease YncB( thermonuclease family)
MVVVRRQETVWLTRRPRETALRHARPRRGMALVRALGLSAVAAGALTVGVSSMPPASPARADLAPSPAANVKVAARIESWNGPLAPFSTKVPDAPSTPATAWSLFATEPSGSIAQARFAPAGDRASVPQFATLTRTEAAPEWQERDFADVAVVDGRTLDAAGLRVRLAGLALPPGDEACRTLDGRIEACATRAATQLELITRWRKVTCRYQTASSGEAVGTCRVGSSDLAERLLKAGYVQPLQATASAPGRTRPI